MSEPDLDLVVFGATSVTGRRVAAYLAERTAGTELRWAAAARDLVKLDRTLGESGIETPEVIAANVDDPRSLQAMAARTRVVVNLVGPYTRFGTPVIEACVGAGADYVDLTGELPFVRRTIDAFDRRAREAGVKLVQVCGFEALPADLGVLLAAEAAAQRWGERLAEVELEFVVTATPPGMPRASDLFSGGTIQSMAEITGDPDAAGITDPALLVDDPAAAAAIRERSPIQVRPRRGTGGSVIAPMSPAAFINPAVIHRTATLVAAESGARFEPFRYREGMAIGGPGPTLPLRLFAAGALSGVQASMAAAARSNPAVRERLSGVMRRRLPGSGFGPAADRLEDWRWGISIAARTDGGHELGVEIDAEGHPGYLATARMLGEAGLALADPQTTPDRAGCLTPATAIGTAGIERFEQAKLRFALSPV